jgi:hypothetical protein
MPYPVHWTSLTIGYESLVDDTSTGKPPLQTTLEGLFRYAAIVRWCRGGHTTISAKPAPGNDRWVAEVIANEINNELYASGKPEVIVCRPEDICVTVASKSITKDSTQGLMAATPDNAGKDVHTRCILREGRWYNERTYRLCVDKAGTLQAWMPCATHSASSFLMATLTWPCHPLSDAKIKEATTQPFV